MQLLCGKSHDVGKCLMYSTARTRNNHDWEMYPTHSNATTNRRDNGNKQTRLCNVVTSY